MDSDRGFVLPVLTVLLLAGAAALYTNWMSNGVPTLALPSMGLPQLPAGIALQFLALQEFLGNVTATYQTSPMETKVVIMGCVILGGAAAVVLTLVLFDMVRSILRTDGD
jgi:hypothetical protein